MTSLLLNLAGCQQLVGVQDLFKLEPISILDIEMANKLGLFNLEFTENIEVEMFSVMTMTSRTAPPQVLHECGICSIFLPGSELPGWYNPQLEGSSISFTVPHPMVWNKTKDLRWTYSPTFYGIPETEEIMLWLSHWKLGDQLEGGDELNVSVVMSTGYQVKKFGIHLVCEQGKEDTLLNSEEAQPNTSSWYQTFSIADVDMYRVRRDAFFLCNHDYLLHQEVSECGWDNFQRHSHLFEQ
ncbi:hypothetical protein GH714_024055 [Hevea brasiliensis]|uniref:TMV resistance protein N-like n=1 Tax=Hevea brasiliensis TaxID=3981 RepID=A0A6A6LEM7_HEVBR|nr:hypothetical protein GH714_024055 [Hevea brasiliensis]